MFLNDVSRRMPALLMMMSTRPKVSTAVLHDVGAALGRGHAVVVRDGLAAGGGDLVDDLLGRGLRVPGAVAGPAEVVDDDERASLGEVEGVRAAEATTGARDDRHLAVEPEISHARRA